VTRLWILMSLACGSSVPSSPLRTGSTKKKEGYYHTQIRFLGRIGKAIPFVSSPDSGSARKTTLGTCPWRKGNRACVGLACGFRQTIFLWQYPTFGLVHRLSQVLWLVGDLDAEFK